MLAGAGAQPDAGAPDERLHRRVRDTQGAGDLLGRLAAREKDHDLVLAFGQRAFRGYVITTFLSPFTPPSTLASLRSRSRRARVAIPIAIAAASSSLTFAPPSMSDAIAW